MSCCATNINRNFLTLKEWILGSRIAIPDKWSLRSCGRKIIRPAGPAPPLGNNFVAWAVKNGSVVDCWWHDGWWEGIVIQKESEDKFHVYFPGLELCLYLMFYFSS